MVYRFLYENKIYVVDTFTGATGGTLISEIAEHLRRKGYDAKKIVNYIKFIDLLSTMRLILPFAAKTWTEFL